MSPDLPRAKRPLSLGHWLLVGLLAGSIFGAGMKSEAVFAALTRGWQAVFGWLGLGDALGRVQQGTSHLVTTRSLPAVATYSVGYVGLCLLLLHLLLRDGRRTRWAAQVYVGLLVLGGLLFVVGRLGGNITWAYKIGRRLIDFAVSPLPVMILLPLLWPSSRRAAGKKTGS